MLLPASNTPSTPAAAQASCQLLSHKPPAAQGSPASIGQAILRHALYPFRFYSGGPSLRLPVPVRTWAGTDYENGEATITAEDVSKIGATGETCNITATSVLLQKATFFATAANASNCKQVLAGIQPLHPHFPSTVSLTCRLSDTMAALTGSLQRCCVRNGVLPCLLQKIVLTVFVPDYMVVSDVKQSHVIQVTIDRVRRQCFIRDSNAAVSCRCNAVAYAKCMAQFGHTLLAAFDALLLPEDRWPITIVLFSIDVVQQVLPDCAIFAALTGCMDILNLDPSSFATDKDICAAEDIAVKKKQEYHKRAVALKPAVVEAVAGPYQVNITDFVGIYVLPKFYNVLFSERARVFTQAVILDSASGGAGTITPGGVFSAVFSPSAFGSNLPLSPVADTSSAVSASSCDAPVVITSSPPPCDTTFAAPPPCDTSVVVPAIVARGSRSIGCTASHSLIFNNGCSSTPGETAHVAALTIMMVTFPRIMEILKAHNRMFHSCDSVRKCLHGSADLCTILRICAVMEAMMREVPVAQDVWRDLVTGMVNGLFEYVSSPMDKPPTIKEILKALVTIAHSEYPPDANSIPPVQSCYVRVIGADNVILTGNSLRPSEDIDISIGSFGGGHCSLEDAVKARENIVVLVERCVYAFSGNFEDVPLQLPEFVTWYGTVYRVALCIGQSGSASSPHFFSFSPYGSVKGSVVLDGSVAGVDGNKGTANVVPYDSSATVKKSLLSQTVAISLTLVSNEVSSSVSGPASPFAAAANSDAAASGHANSPLQVAAPAHQGPVAATSGATGAPPRMPSSLVSFSQASPCAKIGHDVANCSAISSGSAATPADNASGHAESGEGISWCVCGARLIGGVCDEILGGRLCPGATRGATGAHKGGTALAAGESSSAPAKTFPPSLALHDAVAAATVTVGTKRKRSEAAKPTAKAQDAKAVGNAARTGSDAASNAAPAAAVSKPPIDAVDPLLAPPPLTVAPPPLPDAPPNIPPKDWPGVAARCHDAFRLLNVVKGAGSNVNIPVTSFRTSRVLRIPADGTCFLHAVAFALDAIAAPGTGDAAFVPYKRASYGAFTDEQYARGKALRRQFAAWWDKRVYNDARTGLSDGMVAWEQSNVHHNLRVYEALLLLVDMESLLRLNADALKDVPVATQVTAAIKALYNSGNWDGTEAMAVAAVNIYNPLTIVSATARLVNTNGDKDHGRARGREYCAEVHTTGSLPVTTFSSPSLAAALAASVPCVTIIATYMGSIYRFRLVNGVWVPQAEHCELVLTEQQLKTRGCKHLAHNFSGSRPLVAVVPEPSAEDESDARERITDEKKFTELGGVADALAVAAVKAGEAAVGSPSVAAATAWLTAAQLSADAAGKYEDFTAASKFRRKVYGRRSRALAVVDDARDFLATASAAAAADAVLPEVAPASAAGGLSPTDLSPMAKDTAAPAAAAAAAAADAAPAAIPDASASVAVAQERGGCSFALDAAASSPAAVDGAADTTVGDKRKRDDDPAGQVAKRPRLTAAPPAPASGHSIAAAAASSTRAHAQRRQGPTSGPQPSISLLSPTGRRRRRIT